MFDRVTVLDFDHTLSAQRYCRQENEWIDLTDLRQTNGYCSRQSLAQIAARLQKRRHLGITLIGRGNYHYASYLLLSELRRPFTLVLFDHHTDMMPGTDEALISCGSWVYAALEQLPLLRKVVLIGVSEQGLRHIPAAFSPKITVFSSADIRQAMLDPRRLLAAIPTDTAYVSIDKDVLNEQEALTDWDQGQATLRQVGMLLETVAASRHIAGIDICGEYPATPVSSYYKNIRAASAVNERANRYLVERAKLLLKRNHAAS